MATELGGSVFEITRDLIGDLFRAKNAGVTGWRVGQCGVGRRCCCGGGWILRSMMQCTRVWCRYKYVWLGYDAATGLPYGSFLVIEGHFGSLM
jgi:hypothetical protein